MASRRNEQREHRRFPADLHLRSTGPGGIVEMEADNLSLGGAHCWSQRPFEPMTRLDVILDLPGNPGARLPVNVEAVVVRAEAASPSRNGPPYRLALWFQRMDPADRARLRSFLGQDES